MAEYGFAPSDDNESRSILLAGGAAAVGLFALGKKLKPWAGKQLVKDLERFEERAESKLWIDRSGNLVAERFITKQSGKDALWSMRFVADQGARDVEMPWHQALLMGAARGKPMDMWEKFASTNTFGKLADELFFMRELREGYGAPKINKAGAVTGIARLGQYQHLGKAGELDLFHSKLPKGVSGDQQIFYGNRKLFAYNESAQDFTELDGKWWLYGKAGKGEKASTFEKLIGDLTGKSTDPVEIEKRLRSQRVSYLKRVYKLKTSVAEATVDGPGGFDIVADAKNPRSFFHGLPKAEQAEIQKSLRVHSKILKTKGRLTDTTALGKVRNFFDLGNNERGAPIWSREFRDQFLESKLGILNPEDVSLNRGELRGFGAVRSFEWNKLSSYQGALFGGRDGNINAATLAGYHLFSRINTQLAWNGLMPGLALSGKSATSPAAYFGNILLKRALPIYAGAFYAGYANDALGDKLGQRPTDWAQLQWAAQAERWAAWKDSVGISPFAKHVNELSGGALGYIAHPFVDAPVGLTAAELREQHQSGTAPVRKGRWWQFGSSTAFRGDRIQYFAPNYAVAARAGDLNKTSTLYGSNDEYYANAALPTPGHPFAPIAHFITDRYHWEKKHYRDRPYPLTSPLFEPTTPWGALLNPTLGRLIKPTIAMHQDELPYLIDGPNRGQRNPAHRQNLRELNQEIKDQANARDVVGFVTPSGAIAPMAAYARPGGKLLLANAALRKANEEILAAGDEQDAGYDEGVAIGSYGAGARGIAPYGSGKQKVRAATREANAAIKSGKTRVSRFTPDYMLEAASLPGVFSAQDPNDPRARQSLIRSDDPRYQAGLAYYSMTELAGIYGFSAVSATGDFYADRPTLANAGEMTSFERQYWDNWNVGGMFPTTGLSEAFRRFIPHKYHSNTRYNPLRNTMPSWLPGQEGQDPAYFMDFLHGDAYASIPNGEYRLPGASYDQLHGTNGQYSNLDRLSILADVAPWSQQYRRYRDDLIHSDLTDDERARVNAIKAQVAERKKRYTFSPYVAKYSDLAYENVRVKDVIDNNTFTTYEHPDNPIRLAGVHISADDKSTQYISRYIHSGARVRIGIAADETQRMSHDTLHTYRATVEARGKMLNRDAIANDYGTERDENNPAGIHVRYTDREIGVAKIIEAAAHTPVPAFHNKFMPVDSPIELYSRTQVYGKDWQDWRHPFRDYLFPSIESAAQEGVAGLIVAGVLGYNLGVGKTFKASLAFPKKLSGVVPYLKGLRPQSRAYMAAGFMAVTAFWGAIRSSEKDSGIPEYRKRERDVDEYFDILRYIKFEGLYQKTADWIQKHEHHDIRGMVDRYRAEGKTRKIQIQKLKREKRELIVHGKKLSHHKRIKEINREIAELQSYRRQLPLTREDVLALQYHNLAEQTLYGAETNGPLQNVLMAMPGKEREFFQAFLKAPGPERKRILELVPQNERRFLQSAYGMTPDSRPDLAKYFQTHYLPGADWNGWKTDENLNDYKLVVVKHEGLDMTSHGYWPQDELRVKEQGTRDLRPHRQTPGDIKRQIHAALSGMGLRDIDIDLVPNQMGAHKIDLQIAHDRQDESQRESAMV